MVGGAGKRGTAAGHAQAAGLNAAGAVDRITTDQTHHAASGGDVAGQHNIGVMILINRDRTVAGTGVDSADTAHRPHRQCRRGFVAEAATARRTGQSRHIVDGTVKQHAADAGRGGLETGPRD